MRRNRCINNETTAHDVAITQSDKLGYKAILKRIGMWSVEQIRFRSDLE